MTMPKLYVWLSVIASTIGIGMVFGAQLANGTSNTPYWIGGILIVLGAITFGMSITARSETKEPKAPKIDEAKN